MGNVELHCTVEGAHCPETISQKKIIQHLKKSLSRPNVSLLRKSLSLFVMGQKTFEAQIYPLRKPSALV